MLVTQAFLRRDHMLNHDGYSGSYLSQSHEVNCYEEINGIRSHVLSNIPHVQSNTPYQRAHFYKGEFRFNDFIYMDNHLTTSP